MHAPNMNLLQKAGSDDDDAAQSLLQLGVTGTVSSVKDMAPPLSATDEIWDKGKFPVQLHCALRDMEREGMAHIASWAPHDRCFHVYKLKEFVDLVLGRWFRQTKYPSFQRQLNIYGFRCISSGKDKGAYYNKFFLRGKIELAHRLKRMNVKGNGPRQPSNWQEDPNFYDMPFLPATSPIGLQGVMATTQDPTIEASTATAENGTFGAGPAVSQPLPLATVAPPTFANHGQCLHVLDVPHGSLAPFAGHRSISGPSFPHQPSLEASSECLYSPMGCLATSAPQYPWPSINSSRAILLQAYAASRRRATEAALLERYLLLQRQLQNPIPSNGPYDAQMLSMFEVPRSNNHHAPL